MALAIEIEKYVKDEITNFIRNKENMQEYFKDIPVSQQKTIFNNIENKEINTIFIRHLLFKAVISKTKLQ